jgi:ribosomal protein L11 methyltransferase
VIDGDQLLRVAVTVAAEDVEPTLAVLLDLSVQGLEQVDRGDAVELAVYTGRAGSERLRRSFPRASVEVVEQGWEDRWRTFHTPIVVGGLWVGPPWEKPPPGVAAVVIDPGRAFGTGGHATTQLCLELLATSERGSLLDVGCGSGVLAIAGCKLGFEPVVAVDDDPVAVDVTTDNAERNDVQFEVRLVDAESGALPVCEIAVANVLLEPVERILARLESRIAITSGYLAGQCPRHEGWTVLEARERDGWAAHALGRLGAG